MRTGEELTFHYNLESFENVVPLPCKCGATKCAGTIGKFQHERPSEPRQPGKPRKRQKKRKLQKKQHDDICFKCGEGGELVLCDRRKCTKAYHLKCLQLAEVVLQ